MGASRKRGRQELESSEPPKETSMIERIRNMWEFANLAQWIFIFGKAVKIDENLDIEDLEMECLNPQSNVLADIGLALLKFVSSHRGLTPEIFDEYTRRQYLAKARQRNPYGDEEEPKKFTEFDIFTKIRVLQQLTQWTMINPDRIRERMEEHKDSEQTFWRVEPFGWDSHDRDYFVLDDNRLYRQTPAPPPPVPTAPPKKNSKKAKAAQRASKRRKLSEPAAAEDGDLEGSEAPAQDKADELQEYDGLGGAKWECVAITLDQYNDFISSIAKSRDPNEKALKVRIVEDVLPLLEKQEESRKRKAAQKERELLNMEKLAMAKRSSRIAHKLEAQRQEEEAREAERKKLEESAMARKEQEKWRKLEKERESRMQTREQRLKEREARRILHEEELAQLSEDSKKLEAGESRLSERHLKAEIEKKKQALEQLGELEDDWIFDCICGAYGQVDDGTHSISCEKCNVWQHSKCVGVSEEEADRDDFHFICKTCKRREEEAEKAKHRPTIKLKVNRPDGLSSSPPAVAAAPLSPTTIRISRQQIDGMQNATSPPHRSPVKHFSSPPSTTYASPYGSARAVSIEVRVPAMQMSPHRPPASSFVGQTPSARNEVSSTTATPQLINQTPRPFFPSGSLHNGEHAFTPPRPYSPTSLPPPPQPQNYSFANALSSPELPKSSSPPVPPHDTIHGTGSASVHNTPATINGVLDSRQPLPTPPVNGINGRRNSVVLPSPLANKPLVNGEHPIAPTPSIAQPQETANAQSHSRDDLPATPGPSMAGISPIKHSPPRPASSHGPSDFAASAPFAVEAIPSLVPTPQKLNLSPPVKVDLPDKGRLSPHLESPRTTSPPTMPHE